MDAIPPSYETATTWNHWTIVANYIPSADLCSAALVCRKWYDIFVPHLWGNPASHFGVENDVVYVALVRFKRTLKWARLNVREMTHTLCLPPAQAEMYDGPHSPWLRDLLMRLPRLQSLVVAGIPFFDHASLMALRSFRTFQPWSLHHADLAYHLRLLDASHCLNATPVGLTEALGHFPALVYLDLSKTPAAKDASVLSKLQEMRSLRILNLRAIGLADAQVHTLAQAVGTNVVSLDLRGNRITDDGVKSLLSYCFAAPGMPTPLSGGVGSVRTGLLPRFNASGTPDYQSEHLSTHIRQRLTSSFTPSLIVEETSGVGLTHLYLSHNCVTAVGISNILLARRLRVFDIARVSEQKPSPPSHLSLQSEREDQPHTIGGLELTIPIFTEHCAGGLSYMRVGHELITVSCPSVANSIPKWNRLSSSIAFEMDVVGHALYELDSTPPLPAELASQSVVELEGSPVPLYSSTIPQTANSNSGGKSERSSRDTASTREPVHLNPSQPSTTEQSSTPEGLLSPLSPLSISSGQQKPGLHQRTYSMVFKEHEARIKEKLREERRLLPSMLPNLGTLVLTNIPIKTADPEIPNRLIRFIKDCADEARWAKAQSQLAYALPPSGDRLRAQAEYARSLFALRTIVLEMSRERSNVVQQRLPMARGMKEAISSTEDADCDAFWNAARDDFSFFGNEECGPPAVEPGRRMPLASMTEKMVVESTSKLGRSGQHLSSFQHPPRVHDVIAEISAFRKDRRLTNDKQQRLGSLHEAVDGFWDGEIVVLRSANAAP